MSPIPRCRRCGRPLTDQESIDRGLGPDCVGQPPTRRSRLFDAIDTVLADGREPATGLAQVAKADLEAGRRVTPRTAATIHYWANHAPPKARYEVRCDECKTVMRRTSSLAESAAGGVCSRCQPPKMPPWRRS